MKKNVNYLLFVICAFMCVITNINAADYKISIESKENAKASGYGYNSQVQSISGGSCSGAEVYCIDKGKDKQNSFIGCNVINVSNTAFGGVTGNHYDKEYLYRVIAYNSGLTKTSYVGTSIASPENYGHANAANLTVSLGSNFNNKNNSNFTINSDNSITATINVVVNNLSSGNFTAKNGTVTSVKNNGNGLYTVNISNISIKECEGAEVELDVSGVTTTSEHGSGLFYIDCGNSKQNYIVDTSSVANCNIDSLISENGKTTFKFSVPDEDCKECKGGSDLCTECKENGTSHDNYENAKRCANKATFKTYCGTSLKKNTNVDTNTTQITSRTGNVTPNTKLANNKYCKVFCLENIKYNMPGVIKTKNGRYFKLKKGWNLDDVNSQNGDNVSIQGTRTCITSAIKTSYYIEKIEEKQEAVVNAYNTYKRNEQFNKALDKTVETIETGNECTKKNNKGECTSYCTYKKHSAKDEDLKYKKAEVSYNGDGSVNNVKKVDDLAPNPTWITDSNCSSISNSTPPNKLPLDEETINAALQEMYNEINEFKSCFEWTNTYCFDPKAEFSYNEPYKEEMDGELKELSTEKGAESSQYFADVNDNYTGAGSGYETRTLNYIYANSQTIDNSNISQVDMIHYYVKKEVTSSRKFKEATREIYSYHPYGTISLDKCADGKCVSLGYAFPVALQHEGNVFKYNIQFTNVGVGGDDTNCDYQPNRINGDNCSLTATEAGCTTDYSCKYTTEDCPECRTECKCPANNPNCYVEDEICKYVIPENCPTCKVTCVGCVWGSGNSTFAYKQVSVSKIFPNSNDNKDVGYNWNVDSQVNKEYKKAEDTIKEIEKNKQEVYSKPEYSYTLTPQTMSKIRAYNKAANEDTKTNLDKFGDVDTGGYNNDTLKCSNGNECKSTFLDGLDKIVGTNNRVRNENWETYNGSPWK